MNATATHTDRRETERKKKAECSAEETSSEDLVSRARSGARHNGSQASWRKRNGRFDGLTSGMGGLRGTRWPWRWLWSKITRWVARQAVGSNRATMQMTGVLDDKARLGTRATRVVNKTCAAALVLNLRPRHIRRAKDGGCTYFSLLCSHGDRKVDKKTKRADRQGLLEFALLALGCPAYPHNAVRLSRVAAMLRRQPLTSIHRRDPKRWQTPDRAWLA